MILKLRKRPVVVEACQWTGDNFDELAKWATDRVDGIETSCVDIRAEGQLDQLFVWDKLHSTWIRVKKNDYIIKGIKGEFYPHDGEIMFETYEVAE